MVLYVYGNNNKIIQNDGTISIRCNKEITNTIPVVMIETVVIMGTSEITTEAMRLLFQNGINILYTRRSGRIYAVSNSFSQGRVDIVIKQMNLYYNTKLRLEFAKKIINSKIEKEKALLRKKRGIGSDYTCKIDKIKNQLKSCQTIEEIMGVEGRSAKIYFEGIARISDFKKRTHHPATDKFNSLLNLTYSMVNNKITLVLLALGFNSQIGALHCIKNNRSSLSFDILEYFRCDCDNFVINKLNRHEFTDKDFDKEDDNFYLTDEGFKKFISKFNAELELTKDIEEVCFCYKQALIEGDVGYVA